MLTEEYEIRTVNFLNLMQFDDCRLWNSKLQVHEYFKSAALVANFEVTFHILDCNSPDNEREVIQRYLGYDNIIYERLDEDPGLYPGGN